MSKTVSICSTFLKEVLRSSKLLLAAAISLELMSSLQPSFLTAQFWTGRARKSEVLLVQCFNMAEKPTHKQRERRSQQGGELPLFNEFDPHTKVVTVSHPHESPTLLNRWLAPTPLTALAEPDPLRGEL